jgi:methylmalonyl-CoA mutase
LLDAAPPEFEPAPRRIVSGALAPIRWAAPFETLRDRAEAAAPRPAVFFANMDTLAAFGPRAMWTRNLFAAGGVAAFGPEEAHATMETLIDAFRASKARVAVIASTDACYAEHAENCAQRLKAAGADWVLLAGKPGESETKLRAAGVDQFVFAGVDAVKELKTLHAALGIGA